MAKQLTSEQEALQDVKTRIASVLGKRWMFAAWRVIEDEKGEPQTVEFAGRTTWKFPTGDFKIALEQFKKSLEEEIGSEDPAVPSPLKLAKFDELDGLVEQEPEEQKEEPEPEEPEKQNLVSEEGVLFRPKSIEELMNRSDRGE